MQKKEKATKLSSHRNIKYKIYGIFNFKTNKLIYVNLDEEQTELEFTLSNYDAEWHDTVILEVDI